MPVNGVAAGMGEGDSVGAGLLPPTCATVTGTLLVTPLQLYVRLVDPEA